MADSLPELPPRAFAKADPSPDTAFYVEPRFVTHIDDGAIAAVTGLYRELFPAGGTVLDLMSSWVSHLPDGVEYAEVIGHGMNAAELEANPRLNRRFVQDLNGDPALPLPDASGAMADMRTMVIVGSSQTRIIARPVGPIVYTPRSAS